MYKPINFFLILCCPLFLFSCKHSLEPTLPDAPIRIASPANGTRVSTELIIIVEPTGTDTLEWVHLVVDGKATGVTDTWAPYTLKLQTTNYINGKHTVAVKALNTHGEELESNPITLTFTNTELYRVAFKKQAFHISWSKNSDKNFSSYSLYEAEAEDMSNARMIYTIDDRNDTTQVISGIGKDQFRYYKIDVQYKKGEETESPIRRASSFINFVFTTYRDANYEIYIVDFDGENKANISNHPEWDDRPRLSPDGSQVAFYASRDGAWGLHLMDVDGTDLKKPAESLSLDGGIEFSPDGSKLAYVALLNIGQIIHLYNIETGTTRRLTNHYGYDFHPRFFPDGSKIIYTMRKFLAGANEGIYITDITTGQDTKILDNATLLSIFPDGQKILFGAYRNDCYCFFTMNIDGGNQRRITDGKMQDEQAVLSPDGNLIAFTSKPHGPNGDFEIYLMDSDGNNRINLSKGMMPSHRPEFSQDGRQVMFYSSSGIFAVDIDGSNLTRLD